MRVFYVKAGTVKKRVVLEDNAVVNAVEALIPGYKVLPRCAVISEMLYDALGFNAFVFKESEKYEAVKCTLN